MHGIWKQEGIKEVWEQQLCDQGRQIEEKNWLEELEMETINQKVEGQNIGYRSCTSSPNSN